MGRKKDILDRLAERLARGEISEETFLMIKGRYDQEGFPDEEEDVGEIRIRIPKIPDLPELPDLSALHDRVNLHGATPTHHRGDFRGKKYRVLGVGKVGGDCDCDTAAVMGVGKVGGSLRGKQFKVTGVCRIGRDVNADTFENSGTTKVSGSITSKEVRTSGLLKVGGHVETDAFTNSGQCRVDGHVRAAGDIHQSGILKVHGSVETKLFESSGAFKVNGPIKGEEVKIDLSGDSYAGRLEAPEIKVTARAGSGRLRVATVQGTHVYLEATKADLVEGDAVEIGPRCQVDKVVAKTLRAHESAKIGTQEVGAVEAFEEEE